MKKQHISEKKLSISKLTISKLGTPEQKYIQGGSDNNGIKRAGSPYPKINTDGSLTSVFTGDPSAATMGNS